METLMQRFHRIQKSVDDITVAMSIFSTVCIYIDVCTCFSKSLELFPIERGKKLILL